MVAVARSYYVARHLRHLGIYVARCAMSDGSYHRINKTKTLVVVDFIIQMGGGFPGKQQTKQFVCISRHVVSTGRLRAKQTNKTHVDIGVIRVYIYTNKQTIKMFTKQHWIVGGGGDLYRRYNIYIYICNNNILIY